VFASGSHGPITTPAELALSAIVSANVIFQSAIRLSMISIDGATTSVAAKTSSMVIPGPTNGD
jgi:hypothetical protein